MDPNKILVWVQAGGQMASLITVGADKLKAMLAAAGATEAEQDAALDRTHVMYQSAIAHEQAIIDGVRAE